MFRRIDHVALHVSDLQRSIDFYEKHFGFKKYFQHAASGGAGQQIAYLKLADTVLELTHRSDGSMTGFHFCLEAENFDKAVAGLEENRRGDGQGAARYRGARAQGEGLAPGGVSRPGWRAD